ncbi:HAD family hydrolase [Streptococcus iniae]|uniref:HAD family hydrolase n=1 Tax=Streptococcus iniae TaxID=1346 RepID=A0A3L8GQA9_STRIN|nr:HAD-IA family hydrolase [Streptococcus iniae]AGM98197.1 haloacid dehalogenase [Streptococcus iniae SF1]AHY15259.1 haloacid dehalogenase [Streptococcus iniae]AHY17128.1 haloacid dehalogenase [Streptococcus iniae]ASL34236.1 haloacid dehalogenase [Streptococcus iniae]ATX39184.1 Phosphorylated carbohydrates phosphatase [Streptococcus iniae]
MKAIIFDMDGVIVDTEYLDFQLQSVYIKSIAKNPEELSHEDFSSLVGRTGRDLYDRIIALSHTQHPFEEVTLALEAIAQEKYRKEMVEKLFRKDVLKIIAFAKEQGILLGLASSSAMKDILSVLSSHDLVAQFDLIVTGEDFTASKPHPEIYLHSLEKLGVTANQTIVIEDSPSGIAAAKAAGLTVIAYEEKRMQVDQSAADYIMPDMQHIYMKVKDLASKV